MHIDILTIFPDIFTSTMDQALLGLAQKKGLLTYKIHNIRDYSQNKHHKVDDTPYGGGAGMLMSPEPIASAIENIKQTRPKSKVIYFSPRGKNFTQRTVEKFSRSGDNFILLCGRYEGIDQRIIDDFVDYEISIGKYILAGGEFPALVFIESVVRLIPLVLGNELSIEEESFSKKLNGKKEYPQYTRPAIFRGKSVPDVLRSGNHKKIKEWKKSNLK